MEKNGMEKGMIYLIISFIKSKKKFWKNKTNQKAKEMQEKLPPPQNFFGHVFCRFNPNRSDESRVHDT